MPSFLEIKDQCLLKLIWETRASHKHYYTTVDFIYSACRRYTGTVCSSLLPFLSFTNPFERAYENVSAGMCVSASLPWGGKRRGTEKRSRMDSATRSWCNCMLMECASEYGIRMEAVRFDIPFCLRSSPLLILRLYLVIWSSFRICLFLSSLSWATRARLLRRHCMRIENYPSPVLFSIPWDHLRSRTAPLMPRLLIPSLPPSVLHPSLPSYISARHVCHTDNPLQDFACIHNYRMYLCSICAN